jgi:hypothetical protein
MEIPRIITIGEKTYDVSKTRFFLRPSSLSGEIRYHEDKILIKHNLDERDTERTFFHELAHGIFYELENNHPTATKFRNDEVFIQELALHLRLVYKQLLLVEVKQ